MGSVVEVIQGREQTLALPFVYSLLENKEEVAYSKVFEAIMSSAQTLGIAATLPQFIMSDFELAIINAATTKIGDIVHACLFHLCQNVFRRIQLEGLQAVSYTHLDVYKRQIQHHAIN